MTIEEILDSVYPITDEHRKCRIQLSKQQHKRNELQKIIEQRKKGLSVKSPMVLTIDLDAIWKMMNN